MTSDLLPPGEPGWENSRRRPMSFLPKRSFGLKLLLVCALALIMAIPALFVFTVVYDRSSRAGSAEREVSKRYGGEQVSMGPAILLPYTETVLSDDNKPILKDGIVLLYPETGTITAGLKTEIRKSGIYEVPVYTADLAYDAVFRHERLSDSLPKNAIADWSGARVLISMSNSRAAQKSTIISLDGTPLTVEPVNSTVSSDNYRYEGQGSHQLAARIDGLETMTGDFGITSDMSFTGAQSIGFAPFARTTKISLTSDWDDPNFAGGFQQKDYTPSDTGGFTANWEIPYEARGIPGVGTNLSLSQVTASTNQVKINLVNNATPYQSVQRALKYALMFIGFVFLAYFLFEVTSQKRAHPAQYVLVGLAQAVFYLLLLAMAEQFGFDLAFFCAATMTVLLTSAYAMTVFRSRTYGMRALGVFASVYLLMYVLMRLEDYALMVGAFASFVTIGFTMFMTRHIDWYGGNDDQPVSQTA